MKAASRVAAALLAAALLVGCPIPQPLPSFPPGTVTPPRILDATATFAPQSVIPVPADCPDDRRPTYDLAATLFYQDSVVVEARWFVDYKRDDPSRFVIHNAGTTQVPPDPDPALLTRVVPPFRFDPYGYPPPDELGGGFTGRKAPGIVHVVELAVSNGFEPGLDVPEPNRTPARDDALGLAFELQNYRWTFVTVANLPCPAAAP